MPPLTQLVEARHGRFFVLSNDTYISRSMAEYGEWTESEFDLLAQILRPGDNVVDVGANIGCLTVPFAQAVGPGGYVYAFEPQPRVFQLLAANVVLNEVPNARLYHAGCGSQAGTLLIAEPSYETPYNYGAIRLDDLAAAGEEMGGRADAMKRHVPLHRLDDVYDHSSLKLIKIDVEGMEADVLAGASRVIEAFRPAMYIENEFPDRSPELVRAVFDLGYDAYWHVAPLFNAGNANGRTDNVFGAIVCVNMLCVPREKAGAVAGLAPVGSVEEHPRKAA